MLKITQDEILTAVAKAAPKEGQQWNGDEIAQQIGSLMKAEADEELAWQEGRKQFETRFTNSDVAPGDATGVAAWQADKLQEVKAHVAARISANKALVASIGASVMALGATAMSGGATTPVLVQGALGIGAAIANALNDTSA